MMKKWMFSGKMRSTLAASAALILLAACGNPTGISAPIPGLPHGTVIPDGGLCGGVPSNGAVGNNAYTANIVDASNGSGTISLNMFYTAGTNNFPMSTQSIVSQGKILLPNRTSLNNFGYCLSTTDYQSGTSSPGQIMHLSQGFGGQDTNAAVRLSLSALIMVKSYRNGSAYVPMYPPMQGGFGPAPYGTQGNYYNLGKLEARVGTANTCDSFIDTNFHLTGCVQVIVPYLDGSVTLDTWTN